ncbi:alpha-L-rhamnosidase [Plantibacter sp. PA-3-X8]|uniref:alpha-L-rhamnosidase n=1 Tax=Plantibacter sp. PA-3-X8 TaxID=2480625 RepID=UPI000F5D6707|nr:alpha-L-rhamnosidase [Plantibacter sp. PA-3-X8]AZH82022.1 alpha-L-rhamnosidase [Plantibacter sp. PA-3-X8]
MTPHSLTVDRRPAPFGIDSATPEFAWKLPNDAPSQLGYEIDVSTDSSFALHDVLWTSGRVRSTTPYGVFYAGVALRSRTEYHWRVRVHGAEGAVSEWAAASFETGLLSPSDWQADWISHPLTKKNDPRSIYLSTTIELPGDVVRARAYASALGWYRLFINEHDITGTALVPRWTPFHEYTEYQVYDTVHALRAGTNTIGIIVSEGRFRGRLGAFSLPNRYGDQLAALLQLELELADGTTVQATSDAGWTASHGRVRVADPKDGERVDLRLPELPWLQGPAEGSVSAVVVPERRRMIAESVARVEQIDQRPGTVSRTPSGKQLIDFGQNLSGVARVRLSGPEGATVRLLYSEVLASSGEIATGYLGGGPSKKDWFQRDEAILAAEPVVYTPGATIKGFRYLSIEGPADPISADDVEAIVLSTPLPAVSEFHSSDDRLNQLWKNVVWSLRSNFTDTPTDCPTRERSGWTGDIQVFGTTAVQLVDAGAYLRRYLRNLAAEQHSDGTIPPFIPSEAAPGISRNPLGFTRTSAGWGDVAVMLPWTLYQYYGDTAALRDQYASSKAWVDQLATRAARKRGIRRRLRRGVGQLERYVVDTGYHWGEWLRPGESLASEMPGNFLGRRTSVATAYLAHSARLLSRIADVLGEDADSHRYATLAENASSAWRAAFVADGGGRIGDDRQDDYVRALAFDLLEPQHRDRAATRLVGLVQQAGNHLATGFLSTPMLLDTLVNTGHPDVALSILLQTSAPSWLQAVERGATTTWETWTGYKEGEPEASHNHYAFGAVAAFLQERIAGLAPAAPGYARLRIAPIIGGGLTSAAVTIDTPFGRASSAWARDDTGAVSLTVEVPPGVRADIVFGEISTEVGSGTHRFTSNASETARSSQ